MNPLYNIIPIKGFPPEKGEELAKSAIALWLATGFFLENDTFWKGVKWKELDFNDQPWIHEPRDITFDQAVEEFAILFERIVAEQIQNRNVILPLSGGLDSRSLAVALQNLKVKPYSFSYQFQGSFEETKYGKAIAKEMGWPFNAYEIPAGYLWQRIERASEINSCYAEFTHARQMAVVDEIREKGDIWLLGHWGDVLFDDMGVADDLSFIQQIETLKKKIIKKGGIELARDLWAEWGLEGEFDETLNERLVKMHKRINIQNANARIRAFKSLYWATRWTSTNLSYFGHFHPMALPYYDDRMCEFIMKLPEEYLSGRKIQIEYIKRYGANLAKIPWQSKDPYNLFNFHKHKTMAHLPYRVGNKINNLFNEKILKKKLVQRNWEIQFRGLENDKQLRSWLFENENLSQVVPQHITLKYYNLFKNSDSVYWSHPLSMLLTLSVFCKNQSLK